MVSGTPEVKKVARLATRPAAAIAVIDLPVTDLNIVPPSDWTTTIGLIESS